MTLDEQLQAIWAAYEAYETQLCTDGFQRRLTAAKRIVPLDADCKRLAAVRAVLEGCLRRGEASRAAKYCALFCVLSHRLLKQTDICCAKIISEMKL